MKTFFFFFFWRALALVFLVLGLEHSCPWPRECLSSERLSLASDFFCVLALALASSLVFSTPPLVATLELTLHHPLPLCWRRHSIISNQRKGERPPLQCPVVLAIVTFVSKGRSPMRSTGLAEQPIELLSGLIY